MNILPINVEEKFYSHLKKAGVSRSSLKSYKSDFRHFVSWSKENGASIDRVSLRDLNDYKKYLFQNDTPVKTINRRLATLRHFGKFLKNAEATKTDISSGLTNINLGKQVKKSRANKSGYVISFLMGSSITAILSFLILFNSMIHQNNLSSDASIIEGYYLPSNTVFAASDQAKSDKANVPAFQKEVTIRSSGIKANSIINITPLSSTENEVLYIKDQGDGYFVAGYDNPLTIDSSFNWSINN